MNCKLLLSATFLSASLFSTAQDAARTYAITGKITNNFFWADIKQVDVATGKVIKTLYEADKTAFKSVVLDKSATPAQNNVQSSPTGFGVAACALDNRHNRLYFAPMHFSEISFLDLDKSDVNFTTVKKNVVAAPANSPYQTEENQITRMVIAADGYGYALTNDANHLIRFTTGKKPVVEDLGNVVDADNAKGISIHNKCTSWGGDMVADAFGKLVVLSASHNLFSIDVKSRVATLTGSITGLPANFTTNGAAVDNDGNMIVSSANVFDGLYKVNMTTLVAEKVKSTEAPFNASDLANGNFLSQKEANAAVKFDLSKSVLPDFASAGDGKVYPNPVTGDVFNVLFDKQPAGKYSIVLTDLAGRALQSKVVNVSKGSQVETVRITNKMPKGMYLVKVLNDNKEIAFSDKVVIN